MKDTIKHLHSLKNDKNNSIMTGAILGALLDATIDLLEREQPKQEPQKDKWQPLKDGFCAQGFDDLIIVESKGWNKRLVDSGMVCKTEKDAIEKNKLLRAVSRLDSVIREYGEFFPEEANEYNYRVALGYYGKWIVTWDRIPSTLHTYHCFDVITEVCCRLNNGEIEL